MLLERFLLSFRSTFSRRSCLQRVLTVNEASTRSLLQIYSIGSSQSTLQRIQLKRVAPSGLCQLMACEMHPGSTSCPLGVTSAASDDDDRDLEDEDVRETAVNVGQAAAVAVEIQEVPPGSSEKKKKKRCTRREKKKLLKKKLKSSDSLESLMLELPFALTSPTSWKELGFLSPESTQSKRKRKRGHTGGRVDSEEDADKKKKKGSQRPNYFVSVPITNPQISSAVTEVQEAVLRQEPRLSKAMIPVPSLHITLLVTHLPNQDLVDLAAAVLAQAEPSLAELLGGQDLVLPFSGLCHFRKEVVFVGLLPGQHRQTLDRLAELLRSRFEEEGLLQGDCRGFEPHLTIMKLSRASKLRSQGIRCVDPALYSDYTNRVFGDQTVERLDLCSMLKKKQKDGYYHTEKSLQLDLVQSPLHAKRTSGRRRSEPDEAELLRVSRRLVEDAVNRALQQYKQETLQNGGGPNATANQPPESTEETVSKTDMTANAATDIRK
ncbi:A-kinase anchor protein 7 [Thalassophryne amazonica]|uniref:A-kinase anchor protein 7 n=1 Tax=Thalassophryne amazonica TaxID=390379 RepID=UPI0014716AE8|nr:A-kinase anchor protein 7 [Thalassophryne amazonica]